MADTLQRVMPDWPAPANIVAFTTTRSGGASEGPFQGFNLAQHVGDHPQAIARNRHQLLAECHGLSAIQWLDQTHSTTLIDAELPAAATEEKSADASYTTQCGVGCGVMTADCLPVLLCDTQGKEVAAIHAGWRGLAAGIVEEAVQRFNSAPENILAWLGPAISAAHFDVGEEVRAQFLKDAGLGQAAISAAFVPNPGRQGFYFADLYELARLRLHAAGVTRVYGGDRCSYAESQHFYSYRRDGVTGRMLSLIYRVS